MSMMQGCLGEEAPGTFISYSEKWPLSHNVGEHPPTWERGSDSSVQKEWWVSTLHYKQTPLKAKTQCRLLEYTFPHILSCAWYILPFWLNKPRRFSSRSPYLRNLPRILSPISSLCGLVWYPVHTSVIALSLQCTDSFLLVLPSQLDYLRVRPCQWYWHIALTGCLTHSRYL